MDKDEIERKMKELSGIIRYRFKDISWLSKAMGSIKVGKNEYKNETLAIVGDALLKALICDHYYSQDENISKKDINDVKERLENNEILRDIVNGENLRQYTYNDKHFYASNIPEQEKVKEKHDPYIEAMIGAIFYDSGRNWKKLKNWFEDYLFPLLEKYKKV